MEVYGFPRFYLLAWFKECLLTAHHIPNNILVTFVVWEKKTHIVQRLCFQEALSLYTRQ